MNIPKSSSVPVIIISDFDSNSESATLKTKSAEDKHGKLSKSTASQNETPEDERLKLEIRKADIITPPGERERIKTKHKVRLIIQSGKFNI